MRGAAPLAAYVLHRYDWSETSLIVELFTREAGRVVVAAKGAKRPTSQLRPVLLPFQRLAVTLGRTAADAANEVHNLRGAEYAGGVPLAGGDALLAGFYLNELAMKLLARHDPHPRLWEAYSSTLPHLAGASAQPALRAFELLLLRETGLLPDLSQVGLTQQPLQTGPAYRLSAESGLVAMDRDAPAMALDAAQWIGLQAALDHGGLDALHAAVAPLGAALKTQLHGLLHYHLGSPHLRTREVMRSARSLIESTPRR